MLSKTRASDPNNLSSDEGISKDQDFKHLSNPMAPFSFEGSETTRLQASYPY